MFVCCSFDRIALLPYVLLFVDRGRGWGKNSSLARPQYPFANSFQKSSMHIHRHQAIALACLNSELDGI
jgi:hypothetical protein